MVSAGKAAMFASGDESTVESNRSMLELIAPSVNGGPASPVMLQIRGKMADHEYEEEIGGIRIFSGLLLDLPVRRATVSFRLMSSEIASALLARLS